MIFTHFHLFKAAVSAMKTSTFQVFYRSACPWERATFSDTDSKRTLTTAHVEAEPILREEFY